MKKIIALLLVVIMVLSLVACGDSSKPAASGNSASAGEVKPDTTVAPSEMPVVRMCINKPGTGEDEEMVEKYVNEYLAEKYGIQIDIVLKQDNTQLSLMLTGGEDTVDIFTSFWYMSPSILYSQGQLLNLDPYMDTYGAGIKELFKDYPEILDCGKINGSYYGLPAYTAWSTPNIVTVRENVARAADIDWSTVTDLDSATAAFLKMKAATPETKLIPGGTQTYWVPKNLDNLGDSNLLGVIINPDVSTTVESYYESEQFKNFLENVKIWAANDLITPDPMANDQANLFLLMYGICDGTPGYSWSIDEFNYEANVQQNFGSNMEGAQIGEAYITTGTVQTYMWHISSFTKVPEAAVTLLSALYTDTELAFRLAYGIEGEHYTVDENGQLRYPLKEDGTMVGAFDDKWCGIPMDYWPNITGCPTFWYQMPDKNTKMIDSNKDAKISLALGFVFDSSTVADEMAACASVVDQYYLQMINGCVDIDTVYPKFIQELKAAGSDTIIAEKQRQLDTWIANGK